MSALVPSSSPDLAGIRRLEETCAGMGAKLHWNTNRRYLVSQSTGGKRRQPRLSIHRGLAVYPEALADLCVFMQKQGRGTYPALSAAMRAVFETQVLSPERTRRHPMPDCPLVGDTPPDLKALLRTIHGQYFSDLPMTNITWGRQIYKPLKSIRFGSYRSYGRKRTPLITIHPRLALPWVAICFIEHVVHHELCHHYQAQHPLRGETTHSARFRALERQFADYELARRWERARIADLLRGALAS